MRFRLKQLPRYLLLITALSVAVFAQQPGQPSVDRLRNTIMYLASDALEGRRTGTQGANDAAHYIAAEFNMLGLRPGMPGGGRTRGENRARYLQPFPYVSLVELGKNNVLVLDPRKPDLPGSFKVGVDWMPLGFSSNGGGPGGETVFVGYGISSADLKYDDYAGSNVKDRVAIAFAGTPDGDNPHGQFVQRHHARFPRRGRFRVRSRFDAHRWSYQCDPF